MKLHIGGQTTKDGWKILNIQKKDGVDFVGDLSDLSQFSDNYVEEDESDSNVSDTDSDDDNDLIIDNNSIVEEDNIKKIELTLDNKDVLFDDTLNEENLSHLEKLKDQIIVQKEDDDDNNDDNVLYRENCPGYGSIIKDSIQAPPHT